MALTIAKDQRELWLGLREPFPEKQIKWRVDQCSVPKKKAMLLCYLDARDVAARLDRVVGPAGWRVSYEPWQGGSLCTLSLRCPETGEWVSKQDVGTGNQFEKVKGACSDALKRAAAAWGIGRYLYAAPSPCVDVGSNGPIRVA